MVVALASNNIQKVTVPAAITIPAGQTSVTFTLAAVNDGRIDGPTAVNVSASSTGFVVANAAVIVTEVNAPILSLTLADQTVSESAGSSATSGKVTIPAGMATPLNISLSSSNTTAATVPSVVTIPAGQTSVSFTIAAVDDGLDDADKTALITAKIETVAGVILTQGQSSTHLLVANADAETAATPTNENRLHDCGADNDSCVFERRFRHEVFAGA